ncbi:MAG: hypothetical protein WDZ83_03970 [Rhizobiaceae bacterium]
MADFVAVLKKTIGGLSNNTPEARERVYQKARDAVSAKLAAMQPTPSPIVVERQKKALEAAISAVEAGFTPEDEPEDEFAAIFSGAGENAIKKSEPVSDLAPEPYAQAAADPATAAGEPAPDESEEPVSEEVEDPAIAAVPDTGAAPPDKDDDDAGDDLKPAEPVAKPDPVLAGSRAAGRGEADKPHPAQRNRRRISGGLVAALVAILVIAAAGYGIWLNRDAFVSMFASTDEVATAPTEGDAVAEQEPVSEKMAPAEEEAAVAVEPAPAEETDAAATEEDQQKFTQRLTPEGEEVDPGPAGGQPSVGEGTSVASSTQAGDQNEGAGTDSGAPAAPGGGEISLPVGQRAIFYEERTTAADSTAQTGATVWSVVQESPGGDLPPEPAIRAEVTVPAKKLQLRMTIRRNADPSLPASHIIEMIFLTADGFEGGGVDNVLRLAFKPTEAAPGNPLIGIPAKIADGYFLIALSDVPEESDFNLRLLRQQSWIDVAIVYSSGRRALVTMERGVPGDRAFIDVLETWKVLAGEQSSATAGN